MLSADGAEDCASKLLLDHGFFSSLFPDSNLPFILVRITIVVFFFNVISNTVFSSPKYINTGK